MIDEVKKIKLEELSKQYSEYLEKEVSISQRLIELRNNLWKLQTEQKSGMTIRGDFSFFEKWITRRDEYKKFKAQSKRFSKLPQMISDAESELAEEDMRVKNELEKSGIKTKLVEIGGKMEAIERAETLCEIGISPTDAIELLESNGVEPVLSESDKCIFSHPRDYSSKSTLIGVHKTKYAPTANTIKSAKDTNVEHKKRIIINGVEYEYSFKSARDTVHMAMNDEVSSHAYGSWEDCKYAVLIPFEDIPNKKIGRAATVDTFTRGSLELSENAWILCPKNEVNRLKAFNPKVHVLGYEGESVKGFSQPFLTQLGYRAEDVGAWSWSDEESTRQFLELIEKEGIKTGTHSFTYFHEDEQMLGAINQAVSLSKLLRDNHLITTPEDAENIMKQLEDSGQGFGNILSGLCENSIEEGDPEPQSIKGNHKQVDIFLEEMKKNGFNISNVYQDVLRKLCEITIHNCNENNRDMIFNLPENVSEDERGVIEELESVLISDKWVGADDKRAAFGKFLSSAIGDAILHSKERELPKNEIQEEQSL